MFLLMFQEVRLVPDGTMLIHIALILLMIWILNRTFFRPINRILVSRERNQGGHSAEADAILHQVSEKQARYNQAMLQARSEGYELVERERASATIQRQEKIAVVKEEITQKIEREIQELERQTVQAKTVIASEAEQLAEKISANLLKTV